MARISRRNPPCLDRLMDGIGNNPDTRFVHVLVPRVAMSDLSLLPAMYFGLGETEVG
jgi:hypothetical protein